MFVKPASKEDEYFLLIKTRSNLSWRESLPYKNQKLKLSKLYELNIPLQNPFSYFLFHSGPELLRAVIENMSRL